MSRYDELSGLYVPDYNSYWGRIGWLAQQAKVGGDPEHNRWSRILIEPVTPAGVPSPGLPGDMTSGHGVLPLSGDPATSTAPPGPAQGPAQVRPDSAAPGASSIAQMNPTQLAELMRNPEGLTPAQRDEISARLTALGY